MIYPSRIVGVGMYSGNPLITFTLASKSIPFRELKVNQERGKINVVPKKGFENHPTNQDPEVDNYSCIRTGVANRREKFMVAFNGHMCKRVTSHLEDGMNPFTALDLTLLTFRGAPNDARIGAISCSLPSGETRFFLGINDADRGEKRIISYPNDVFKDLSDRVVFVYDANTSRENLFDLRTHPNLTAKNLARFIHHNILSQEIAFGLATGVALMKPGEFELAVYNRRVDKNLVERWRAEMKAKSPELQQGLFFRYILPCQ